MAEETAAGYLDGRIDALREHVASLAAAVPALPAQFARVGDQLAQDWQAPAGLRRGTDFRLSPLGFAIEALYRRWVAGPGSRMAAAASAHARSGCDSPRDVGALAAFAIGSAALFLAFDWPPRTRGGGRLSSPRSSHCARSSSQAARCSRRATRGCASFLRATARRVLAPAHRALCGLVRVRLGGHQLARAARHGPRFAADRGVRARPGPRSPSRRSGAARVSPRPTSSCCGCSGRHRPGESSGSP